MTARTSARQTAFLRPANLAILLLAVAAIVAAAIGFGGFGRDNSGGGPLPSGNPTAKPSVSPSVSPSPIVSPTPRPTRDPNAPPIKVRLTASNGSTFDLDIVDYSLLIEAAEGGVPGDGASVEWGTVKVEQLDGRTLRLTWTNTPGSGRGWMTLDEAGRKIVIAQPEYEGDSIAFDRVLVLEFVEDVEADDFEIILITSNHADS
jgi:hypothetical protein